MERRRPAFAAEVSGAAGIRLAGHGGEAFALRVGKQIPSETRRGVAHHVALLIDGDHMVASVEQDAVPVGPPMWSRTYRALLRALAMSSLPACTMSVGVLMLGRSRFTAATSPQSCFSDSAGVAVKPADAASPLCILREDAPAQLVVHEAVGEGFLKTVALAEIGRLEDERQKEAQLGDGPAVVPQGRGIEGQPPRRPG